MAQVQRGRVSQGEGPHSPLGSTANLGRQAVVARGTRQARVVVASSPALLQMARGRGRWRWWGRGHDPRIWEVPEAPCGQFP